MSKSLRRRRRLPTLSKGDDLISFTNYLKQVDDATLEKEQFQMSDAIGRSISCLVPEMTRRAMERARGRTLEVLQRACLSMVAFDHSNEFMLRAVLTDPLDEPGERQKQIDKLMGYAAWYNSLDMAKALLDLGASVRRELTAMLIFRDLESGVKL